MKRKLILLSRNIVQDSFVKLYFPHGDMHRVVHFEEGARPHFNWKTIFANTGISHDKQKLVSLPSYLYNGNAYTVNTTFLPWESPCFLCIIWGNGITGKHIWIYTLKYFFYIFCTINNTHELLVYLWAEVSTDVYQLNHYYYYIFFFRWNQEK